MPNVITYTRVTEQCGCVREGHKYVSLCSECNMQVMFSDPFIEASDFAVRAVSHLLEMWDTDDVLRKADCVAVPKDVLKHLTSLAKMGLDEVKREALKK